MRHSIPRLIRGLLAALFTVTVMMYQPAEMAYAADRARITFACAADNDLYVAVSASGVQCSRVATPTEAVEAAPSAGAVLLLADAYPNEQVHVTPALLARARSKDLRLYVEFPDGLPGQSPGPATAERIEWERVVVTADRFGGELPRGRILMAPDCRFVGLPPGESLLALARVAGFDTAVYGLPRTSIPLLTASSDGRLFAAASKLSSFRRGRFGPAADWVRIWERLLALLAPDAKIQLKVSPAVAPAFGASGRMPRDAERTAFHRGVSWYRRSGLLLTAGRLDEIKARLIAGGTAVAAGRDLKSGDGSHGILEGLSSTVRLDGSHDHLIAIRADCNADAAMVFALDADLNGSRASAAIARNLLKFTFDTMKSQGRDDPRHPAFGLIAWGAYAPAWETANYGDDSARTILATLIAQSALRTDDWDRPLVRALFANLRTTGTLGFRGDRIDIPALERDGWRHYYEAPTVNYSPHFEAFLWACYLWAYQHTHYQPFLERARTAIKMTMEVYPAKWRWKDSLERAHMLLALAWMVRVEDTAEHREWLSRVATDLIAAQQPCGAIREKFAGGGGHLHAPASNEAYGTGEAPLVQKDGDPVSDQLYTTGFALLGLREAAAASADPRYTEAENRLAEYLCRIQVRSSLYPFVDGAWFRAFDYGRWDYWGSAADTGWGPWNAESGWGPAWINAMLALRAKKRSVWEFTAGSRAGDQMTAVQAEMAQNTGEPLRRQPGRNVL